VLKSALLVRYKVEKTIAKIWSFLDVLLIRVCQIEEAKTVRKIGFCLVISYSIRSASVIVILRFRTINTELSKESLSVTGCAGTKGTLLTPVSLTIANSKKYTLLLIGKALI
jgi:hypothetical protein